MATESLYTDKQLFELIAKGDHTAFELLMDKFWNLLYSQAIAFLKDSFKAQDVVQEVFLAIWKDRQKLADVSSPENYLFIVAKNTIFNEARKRIMMPLLDSLTEYYAETYLNPDQVLDTREVHALIQSAVNRLPPQRKRIFELSRNEGLSYEAIAGLLGISRETVKVQMVKALSFLRRFVRNYLAIIIFLIFFFTQSNPNHLFMLLYN